MNFFFYTTEHCKAGCALRNMMAENFPSGQIVTISTVDDFNSPLLGLTIRNNDLVFLAIETPSELDELLTLRYLFDDVRLLIFLAYCEEEALTKVHLLRPRYLSVEDCNPKHICAVIRKMLNVPFNNAPLSQRGL